MVWDTFSACYYKPRYLQYVHWDLKLQHRKVEEADPKEVIDIEHSADIHQLTKGERTRLDRVITQEVYDHLTAQYEEINEHFLESKGFKVIKGLSKEGGERGSSTRVIYHESCPDLLIKVGRKACRELPMEGVLRRFKFQSKLEEYRDITKESVYRPIQNLNLLRAAGKDYFINHLTQEDLQLFSFPDEYLYKPSCIGESRELELHKKYFAVSRRVGVISAKETKNVLHQKPVDEQRRLARKIVDFIKKTRMHDFHGGNLVLNKDRQAFCVIDTEPLGILIDQQDTGASLLNPIEHVLLGLTNFRYRYCMNRGLTAMALEVDKAIVDYLEEHENELKIEGIHFNYTKLTDTSFQDFQYYSMIALSIATVGILPLILLVSAIFSEYVYCDSSKHHFTIVKTSGAYWHQRHPNIPIQPL